MPDGREVVVGTIVRVPLQGRSVRGWVVETEVESDTDPTRLRPLKKIVGAGPPAELVSIADWAAWRWAGPAVAFLRVASPENAVPIVPLAGRVGGSASNDSSARSTSPIAPLAGHVGASAWDDSSARSTSPIAPLAGHVGASAWDDSSARSTYPRGRVRVHRWAPASPRGALVAGLLAESGSTIVVLPDARRTGALVRSLADTGRTVHVLRSDQSGAERTRVWRAVCAGNCIVVGGRTAVWAPVPDLGAIVVLDEGDEALKEERAPAWHARDVAIERARRLGIPVELVTPVPTVDALVVADEVLRPSRPDERAGWPLVDVVDRRTEPPGFGLLTASLGDALHRAVDATASGPGGRAVCVLNRKGRARLLACVACGELVRCEVCSAAVIETDDRKLSCLRCAATRPKVCLHCHATRMKAVRPGVARVREDLSALLPHSTVVEVEAATVQIPPADVLVGTEAVLHRVPVDAARPVRLVVFLDADQELLAPRVHAAEQALFLLARAARLVGRRSGPGRILIQTRVPDHEVIEAVRHADPDLVTDPERTRRQELGYPPFGGLAEVSGASEAVDAIAAALRVVDEDHPARARRCRCGQARVGAGPDPRNALRRARDDRSRGPQRRPPTGRGRSVAGLTHWYPCPVDTYPIRQFGDPVLKQRAREVTEIDGSLAGLVNTMYDTMYEAAGVGLAAPQVGMQKRIFTYDVGEGPQVMINPVVAQADGEWVHEEGCLSVPGLSFEVVRAERVVVSGIDLDGNEVIVEDDDFLGRVFLHEIDHLDGILVIDRLDPEQRKQALRALRERELVNAGDIGGAVRLASKSQPRL